MISISGTNWDEIKLNNRKVEKFKTENNYSEILAKLIIINNFDRTEIHSIDNKIELFNPFLKKMILLKVIKS